MFKRDRGQTDRQTDSGTKKTETEKWNKMKFKSINKVFFQKTVKIKVECILLIITISLLLV